MDKKIKKFLWTEKVGVVTGLLIAGVCFGTNFVEVENNLHTITTIETEQISVARNETVNVMASADGSVEVTGTFGMDFTTVDAKAVDRVLASYGVPNGEGVCNSAKKTYMGYDAVTSRTSAQYKLLNSVKAWSDPETGLRMYEDRICIAIGQGYAQKIGTKVNLVMANGSIVRCVVGDFKATVHTDPTMRYQKYDGSVAEMIVDYAYFDGTYQYPSELRGKIIRIDIVE